MMSRRAILGDAGVPYRWSRAFGPVAETIAAHAALQQSDAVIVDASQLGFLTRWWIIARLWRLTKALVTMLHQGGSMELFAEVARGRCPRELPAPRTP
ncbi:hypothetical protein QYH69_16880 [Paraburkholderia sp. SARCC-3016]|uniref:hypothetical protein n=1 Tax=Paraburkholderia sp. SARCC-3016 TaxID=3058611 RepID=UPI00280787D5|nr:hypothetical protein [Paraburkholderia sp. SARCC-3016]MDQ7978925.1 hypothetical protein [Paraburkholderia sp. SARCC-3016]